MGKKKSTWVSPTKQRIIDAQNKRDFKRKVTIIVILSILAAVAVGFSVFGIVMACRPYYAFIEIEGYGTIVIELNDSEAPETVDAFIELVESGHYNGSSVYRALEGQYFQAGFREGATVETIMGEFSKNGHENNLSHTRGTISMSRQTGEGDEDAKYYNTSTGQFFILQRDNLTMDGKYAAFGTVIEGMEIVDLICAMAETDDKGNIDKESRPIITSIRIERSYNK